VVRFFLLQAALLVLVAILIYLGLTPLAFRPPNRVARLPADSGIVFEGRGLIYSENPLTWAGPSRNEFSMHLLVEPSLNAARGFGALLSIDDGESQPPLLIAQWKDGLNVRVRKISQRRGYWEIGARDALIASKRTFVSIVSDPEHGTQIYIDGELRHENSKPIIQSDGGFGGRLVFGSLRDGSDGWSGTLRGLAIYAGSLGEGEVTADARLVVGQGFAALARRPGELAFYSFGEGTGELVADRSIPSRAGALVIPRVFAPLAPKIFEFPKLRVLQESWFLWDGLRNILGFIPLGFLAVLLLIKRKPGSGPKVIGSALLLGGCLSLAIEGIQVLLPMRNSSSVDLILNVFGTGLGAALALWVAHVVPIVGTRRPMI
jgi:VanZ family protein